MTSPDDSRDAEPARDPVHGADAARWGGWEWNEPCHTEHFRRCSYCGSVNPDDLVAEPDWHANWADMKYGWPHKFYVDIPNRDPDRRYIVSASDTRPTGLRADDGWIAWDQIPDDVHAEGWGRGEWKWALVGTRPQHGGKFYTAHLADPRISDDVRERIHAVCGLRFTWNDGRVSWRRTQ